MLAELSGLSRTTIGRSLAILVEDPVADVPLDPEDYDPVIWNYDKRPRRQGGMFTCERRGSFAAYRKSLYRLNSGVAEKLGWIVS